MNKNIDRKFIAIGHGAWGKQDTIADAVAMARKHLGSARQQLKANIPAFTVYLVHPDTTVGGMGGLTYPDPDNDNRHAPIELGNFDYNAKAMKSDAA